ncbi:SDR family oxidoreductase [Segeticoccus rhizosphaerae]|jgi:3-oxoacyl-[acyl-carrier protein] reductase|uniref:SDR family oxidoreductase n=1 Tax=Segeticoccus rhizosphaerae TaxID=1104777 RepID=UPI0010BF7CBA|nr:MULTISPECIES: SDR family oxidoreductase [Intrasporangiaceae]
MSTDRPIALVTGVGRTAGIGAAVALRLASDGWDVATTYWAAYDDRMPWGRQVADVDEVGAALRDNGARSLSVSADFERPEAPAEVFDQVERDLGPVTALVMCHCESVDSSLLDTSVESFDRHNVVNPGPVDTGWMSDELREQIAAAQPRGRGGRPSDTAALVSFLCSSEGEWINGQLLHSDGGLHA